MANGNLFLVSVPIGNLKDITLRAIETLKQTDVLIAEDTRQAGKLLLLLGIEHKNMLSYRDQNHEQMLPRISEILASGKSAALISDRGTPTISDPGYKLVRDLMQQGFNIIPIPGPVAAIAALTASGLPTDKFSFLGFLPKSSGKQAELLEKFGKLSATFIIYESPFRVIKLLETIRKVLGEIPVSAIHELTKVNETVVTGKVSEVLEKLKTQKPKGEWVVLGRYS
jgi:16S rRNA (cytidine1402-2'-O)-methyltransferase